MSCCCLRFCCRGSDMSRSGSRNAGWYLRSSRWLLESSPRSHRIPKHLSSDAMPGAFSSGPFRFPTPIAGRGLRGLSTSTKPRTVFHERKFTFVAVEMFSWDCYVFPELTRGLYDVRHCLSLPEGSGAAAEARGDARRHAGEARRPRPG